MQLNIDKYDASGNDFIIFHSKKEEDYSFVAKILCNRETNIGADGLIVIVPYKELDFKWLFYNSDGSYAAMCGNGTRACAHYAYTHKLAPTNMKFLTGAGVIECEVDNDIVQTTMTTPKVIKDSFEKLGYNWKIIDTGVPHIVTIVDDLDKFDLEVCSKMRYKYNANVNFAKVEDKKLYVRTYERGVEGETLACGTGMVAFFLRAFELGLLDNIVNVYPKSGEELTISFRDNKLYFKGKVKKEFSKTIQI
jgi:diaminopimelate epimerase